MISVALRSGLAKSGLKERRKSIPNAKLAKSRPCIPAGRQAVTNGSLGTFFVFRRAGSAGHGMRVFGGVPGGVVNRTEAGEVPAADIAIAGFGSKTQFPTGNPVQIGESFIALAEVAAETLRALGEDNAGAVEKRMPEAMVAVTAAENTGAGQPEEHIFPVSPA